MAFKKKSATVKDLKEKGVAQSAMEKSAALKAEYDLARLEKFTNGYNALVKETGCQVVADITFSMKTNQPIWKLSPAVIEQK